MNQTILEKFRPTISETTAAPRLDHAAPLTKVLVLGTYLADAQNNIDDIVSTLSASTRFDVTQRWIALGRRFSSTQTVLNVTVEATVQKTPKFQIIDRLLSEDLGRYEYVLVVDDDVVLPYHFVDRFISLQTDLGFSMAQPAQTSNSYIDYPIVEQQRGVIARQTLFVERDPVVSFHNSIYDLTLPFDLTNPMGRGYENVWSYLLDQHNLKMGIIDIVPVDHSLRQPGEDCDGERATRESITYLERHNHIPYERCFTVLDVITSLEK